MKRGSLAGLGALAFGVLTILGLIVESAPGGTYKASDVADYVRKQGRVPGTVWLGSKPVPPEAYLRALAGVTRVLTDGKQQPPGEVEIKPTPLAAAKYVADDDPKLWGWVIVTGGCILLGSGVLTFVTSAVAIPAWLRWATAIAGVAAIAAAAWCPLALVILWAVAVGVWLLVRGGAPATAPVTA